MDINDFKGLTKFKVIIPAIYIFSWLSMLVGPIYFAEVYQIFCIFFLAYTNFKVLILLIIMIIVTVKSSQVFRRMKNETIKQSTQPSIHEQLDATDQTFYGFIIPNYKQDVEMMSETLECLASHKRAKGNYLIFLAMQEHEEGSQKKAQILINAFESKFRVIDFTKHQIRQYQQKGKASNVSWCAQHLEPIFKKNVIPPQNVFLTIMDADSWAPNIYFDIMEQHIYKNYNKRHLFIYQAPQIFTRNHMDVPIFTRVYDMMHSFAHCSNLFSIFNLTFPLSNYTLSYELVKRIGFWDTCPDAIGEDFHTTQKAFWKTNGEIITVPIYAPFNQVNIATGKGYTQDVLARFWQAERHAQGVADVAYNLKMLLKKKFKLMNFVLFYQIFETFALPALLPWVLLSMIVQSKIVVDNDISSNSTLISIFFNGMSIGSTLGYMLHEILKRRSNSILYKRENESLLRVLEYPLLFIVNLFMISVPTFTIAAFMTLFGKREYIVAEKKMKTRKQSTTTSAQ